MDQCEYVYVLNKEGKPLMPTKNKGKVRKLLKSKRAKVVRKIPFTIQLLYETPNGVQPIIAGYDTGSGTLSISAVSEKEELFRMEGKIRNDVKDNLTLRKELRRGRRNRKTRHRKARFKNRKNRKGKNPPSVEVKIQEHITALNLVCSILPVSKVIVESGQFDTQKMEADFEGENKPKGKDYQQGRQYGFQNVKQYVLDRDNRTCQICGKKDGSMEVHHIQFRSQGGTDTPDNLVTLCPKCHKTLHKKVNKASHDKKWDLTAKDDKRLKHASHMNCMRSYILEEIQREHPELEVIETFGYITKTDREYFELSKEHYNDAFSIACGVLGWNMDKDKLPGRSGHTFKMKFFRRHRRDLRDPKPRKGDKVKWRIPVNSVKGFHLYDLVKVVGKSKYQGLVGFITCLRKTGSFEIKDIDGSKLIAGITATKLKLIMYNSSFYII